MIIIATCFLCTFVCVCLCRLEREKNNLLFFFPPSIRIYKCETKAFFSILDGYEKDSNSEGVQQFLISAQKTCPHFNLPSCSGHVDRNRSLIFLYIFIYLFFVRNLLFFHETGKEEKTQSLWGVGSFDKSQKFSCSLPQSTTTTTKRKENKKKKNPKVSGVCQVSLCSLFSSLYLFYCAPTALWFIHTSSPLVFSKRKKKRKKKVEKGGRRRKSHQQYLRCGMLEASGYPGLLQPHLPSCLDRNPERGESGSGDGDFCCRRGGGWLCWSPVFSS